MSPEVPPRAVAVARRAPEAPAPAAPGGVRPCRRPGLAWGGLAGVLSFGVVLAVGGAGRRSTLFPTDVERLPPRSLRGAFARLADHLGLSPTPGWVALLILGATASYFLVLAGRGALPRRTAVGAVLFLHLAFVLAPPLLSADVFGYLAYARLGVVHRLNPYLHAPVSVPGDPLLPFVGLQGVRSPYGPLFTLATYPLASLGIAAWVWLLKALAGLAALVCLGLVSACARRLGGDARAALAFVGLNPLWLVWGVGGAHNDLLMMAVSMGGVALVLRGRAGRGCAAGVVAAAVKPTAAVLVPFQVLGSPRRRQALLGAACGLAAVVGLAVLAFGAGAMGFLDAALRQSRFVSHYSLPSVLARTLGLGQGGSAVRAASTAVSLVGVLAALRSAHRGGDWVAAAGWALLAVVAAGTWMYPWYLVWVLPLAAAGSSSRLRGAALVATALTLAVRLPFGLTSPL